MKLTLAEENYLKAIYHLSEAGASEVSTNALAESMETRPASVSDMVKRLSQKGVIQYQKYKGVNISKQGKTIALGVIRKHRLWEVFLVEKLGFNWDEVHEIAEQMEHIQSPILVERLDDFLGNPVMDPHGDPIPDKNGVFHVGPAIPLSELVIGDKGVISGVTSDDQKLLQYLDKIRIGLGTKLTILEIEDFDGSMKIETDKKAEMFISKKTAQQLLVSKMP
ncbi:MAG: metal-dependent transcriptional regulator [Bacteroidota bacterium]